MNSFLRKFFQCGFLLILCLLWFSTAFALTISPAEAKISKDNKVLTLSIINTEEDEFNVAVDLGNFFGAAVLSTQEMLIPSKGNKSVNIVFYDNVCRKGNICVLTVPGEGATQQVTTVIKICLTADVVTTASGKIDGSCGEAKITPEVIKALIEDYQNSKKKLLSKLDYLKRSCVEFSKSTQFQQLVDSADGKNGEASNALKTEQLILAQSLVSQANELLSKAEKILPVVKETFHDATEYIFSEKDQLDYIKSYGVVDETILSEAKELISKIKIGRSVVSYHVVNKIDGKDYFTTAINFDVVNMSPSGISQLKVVDFFSPKLVSGISGFFTKNPFAIIREFPIAVQFDSPDVPANGSSTITYCLNKETTKDSMQLFAIPIPTYSKFPQLAKGTCTANMDCDDSNPCTEDKCSSGACELSPLKDGVSCGNGLQCVSGQCLAIGEKAACKTDVDCLKDQECKNSVCIAKAAPVAITLSLTEIILLVVGVGILVLLFIVMLMLLKRKKENSTVKPPAIPPQQ